MKWLKRISKLLALGLLLLLAGTIGWVHYYLNSPRVSEKIRRIVAERFFTRLEFDKAGINLFTGLKVQNARLFKEGVSDREFASLDEAILEYSPISLLRNTVEVKTVFLKKPSIQFEQREDGRWRVPRENSDILPEMIFRTGRFRFNVLLNNIVLEEGRVEVINSEKEILFQATGVDVNGQLKLLANKNDAKGMLLLKTLQLGSYTQLTDIQSPFEYADSILKLPELKGKIHGGSCEGTVQLNTGIGGPGFLVDIAMKGINLSGLLKKLNSSTDLIQGQLQLHTQLTGDLNQILLIQGTGNLEVGQAKLSGIPALDKLGELLSLARLSDNTFESIRGSFKVGDQKITFYELEAKSPNLSLTGTGYVGFDRKLDFDVLLILSPELASQIPTAYQAQFSQRENGSRTITFKLNGSLDEPVSNLSEKLSPAATESIEQVLHRPLSANPAPVL